MTINDRTWQLGANITFAWRQIEQVESRDILERRVREADRRNPWTAVDHEGDRVPSIGVITVENNAVKVGIEHISRLSIEACGLYRFGRILDYQLYCKRLSQNIVDMFKDNVQVGVRVEAICIDTGARTHYTH